MLTDPGEQFKYPSIIRFEALFLKSKPRTNLPSGVSFIFAFIMDESIHKALRIH